MIKRIVKDFNVVDICILILTIVLVINFISNEKKEYNIKIKEIERQIAFANAYSAENLTKDQIDAIVNIVRGKNVAILSNAEFKEQLRGSVLMVPDIASIAVIRDVNRLYPTLPIIIINSEEMSHFRDVYEKSGHDIPVGIIYKEDGKIVSTITEKVN